jgi:hypothetical protein
MSVPPLPVPASLSTSGYEDGFGRRTLTFDRETGGILERLQLAPELGAFEQSLRERVERSAAFEDERFARIRGIERDPRTNALVVISESVSGNRFSDLLEGLGSDASDAAAASGIDPALGFLLEVLPALAALQTATGFSHGAVGPGRIVVTSAGHVVLLDWIYAQALERLHLNRDRLWRKFGLAMPASPGQGTFDGRSDVAQAALTAVMIVIGRALRADEYPDGLTTVVSEVVDIAQIRGTPQFATGLQRFLHRALPLPGSRPFPDAEEAATTLRQIAREIGLSRCRAALGSLVAEFNRDRVAEEVLPGWENSEIDSPAPVEASVAAFTQSAEAQRSDSAALEFEIELDDVLGPLGSDQTQPLDEPVAYDILLTPAGAESDDERVVVLDSTDLSLFDREVDAEVAEPSHDVPSREHAPYVEPQPAAVNLPPVPSAVVVAEPPQDRAADTQAVRADATLPADVAGPTEVTQPSSDPVTVMAAAPAIASAPSPAMPADTSRDALLAAIYPFGQPDVPASPTAVEEPPTVEAAAVPVVAEPPRPVTLPSPPAAIAPVASPNQPSSRQRRRGAKHDRDKLRSIAKPVPLAPVTRPRQDAIPTPPPMPYYPPVVDPRQAMPAAPTWSAKGPAPDAAPIFVAPKPATPSPLRVKSEAPSGYVPVTRRATRHEPADINPQPYVERAPAPRMPSPYWKIGGAAALAMAVGVGVIARPYLTGRAQPVPVAASAPAAAVPERKAAPLNVGTLSLVTQPAGARVLLDGAPAGETPLTLESIAPGRHTVTFVTPSATVRRTIRVEAGKTASLDVAVYSGWIAVFSPVLLEITENGRSIGTSEQGRLMLAPGRHQLTFSNRDLGYTSTQAVDIEAGEERSVNIQATGELNVNALPWAEVWVDGQKSGDTPIAKLRVPLGTHELVFKNPQYADRRLTTTIRANVATAATVDFTKPPVP